MRTATPRASPPGGRHSCTIGAGNRACTVLYASRNSPRRSTRRIPRPPDEWRGFTRTGYGRSPASASASPGPAARRSRALDAVVAREGGQGALVVDAAGALRLRERNPHPRLHPPAVLSHEQLRCHLHRQKDVVPGGPDLLLQRGQERVRPPRGRGVHEPAAAVPRDQRRGQSRPLPRRNERAGAPQGPHGGQGLVPEAVQDQHARRASAARGMAPLTASPGRRPDGTARVGRQLLDGSAEPVVHGQPEIRLRRRPQKRWTMAGTVCTAFCSR